MRVRVGKRECIYSRS